MLEEFGRLFHLNYLGERLPSLQMTRGEMEVAQWVRGPDLFDSICFIECSERHLLMLLLNIYLKSHVDSPGIQLHSTKKKE